jgi:hypothetical protein
MKALVVASHGFGVTSATGRLRGSFIHDPKRRIRWSPTTVLSVTVKAVGKRAVLLNVRVNGCPKRFFNFRVTLKAAGLQFIRKRMFAGNLMGTMTIDAAWTFRSGSDGVTAVEADIIGRIGGGFPAHRSVESVVTGGTGAVGLVRREYRPWILRTQNIMCPMAGGTVEFPSMRSLGYCSSWFAMAGGAIDLFKFFGMGEILESCQIRVTVHAEEIGMPRFLQSSL